MGLLPWDGTVQCLNCGAERLIRNGIGEECPVCGDEEFDVALIEEQAKDIPVLVGDTEE